MFSSQCCHRPSASVFNICIHQPLPVSLSLTHTRTQRHARTQARTHARTHAHTHTRTHTHTHTHYSAVKHACKEHWVFWCSLKFYEERGLFCRRYYSQPLTFSKHVSTASDRPQTFKVKSVEYLFIYVHSYCFMKMECLKIHHMQSKPINKNTVCSLI